MELDVVPLGPTGTKVSEIGFGTWRFGREIDDGEIEVKRGRAFELLDAYADSGGNFIDTADSYGGGTAEELVGDWLQNRDREEYVLGSKIYWPTRGDDPNGRGLNRKHLRRQLALILDRLRTTYLDVLYIHGWDDDTPVDELMRTLSVFVDDGRVNYLGTATREPSAWRVVRANELARREGYEPFKLTQPRFNLVTRDIECDYLEMCLDYGIGVLPCSPLAGGLLSGKYQRGEAPPDDSRASIDESFADSYLREEYFDVVDVVEEVAEDTEATPAQVALTWLLHHEEITAPIVGARTIDQLDEDLRASGLSLTDEQFAHITEATRRE